MKVQFDRSQDVANLASLVALAYVFYEAATKELGTALSLVDEEDLPATLEAIGMLNCYDTERLVVDFLSDMERYVGGITKKAEQEALKEQGGLA